MPLMVGIDLAIHRLECVCLTLAVGLTGKKEGKTRLMNMVMQVSNCCRESSRC